MTTNDPFLLTASETWVHAGLQCALKPAPIHMDGGGFNGYVNLPEGHPYAGKDYDDIPVEVHGGLTFSKPDGNGGTWVGWDDAHYRPCPLPAKDETSNLAEKLATLSLCTAP